MLYALRDIAADEEILMDYSTAMNEPGWRIRCQCGAESCRGKVVSYCDMTSEEQIRLGPITLRYLRSQAEEVTA
jgi:hypothetical protein